MRVKAIFATLAVMIGVFVAVPAVPVSAASDDNGGGGGSCKSSFLTFPAWYDGLTNGDCSLKSPKDLGGIGPYLWKIALNIIEIMLQAVVYISIGFIIYGGFTYLTSISDSPAKITRARKLIQNAIIGLVISFFSIAIVNLVAQNIK